MPPPTKFATDLAALGAAALAYFLLARFGMAVFALQPSNITPLWLPSGLALVMCRQWGWRAAPFILLASFAANFPGMTTDGGATARSLGHTLVAAGADVLAGMMAAALFARLLPRGLLRIQDLLPFGLVVCLVPTAVTATILSVNLAAGGYIGWSQAPALFRTLLLADGLGLLLVYPVYQGWRDRLPVTATELTWLAGAGAGIALLLWLAVTTMSGLLYFVAPALLVLAFNVRMLGVTALTALTLVAVIAATAMGHGPYADGPGNENFRLMAFVYASALTILGIVLQNRQLVFSQSALRQWQAAAEHDALTGLANRRALLPLLEAEHQRSQRTGHSYAVAMIDIDRFKTINDTWGHAAGDEVLRAVASVLAANARGIDTVARLGGDEFALLLPESDAAQASVAVERARLTLAQTPLEAGPGRTVVKISAGIAADSGRGESGSALLARADRALYAAKAAGRDRIIVDGA